jgi:hypothetical protein
LKPPEWNGGDEENEICNKGSRVPFCIACINWVRRLSNYANKPVPGPGEVGSKRKRGGKDAQIVPIDNLMLYIQNPGSIREPDKRTMYRLLQNACIEYTGPNSNVRIGNPYLCYASHIVIQVLNIFKRKYFKSYQFDTRCKDQWLKMKGSKSSAYTTNGSEMNSSAQVSVFFFSFLFFYFASS